jgi:signal transduction histidine kinase
MKILRIFRARVHFASLRVRLSILILLAVIPAFGITLYSGIERRGYECQRVLEDALEFAHEIAITQEELIRHARQTLFTLSRTPQVQQKDNVACTKIFTDLMHQSENYAGILAAKPNGDVFASSLPLSQPLNLADRPWYQRLLKKRNFVVGEYQIGWTSGKLMIVLAYPVMDDLGNLEAILAAGLDLQWVNQAIIVKNLPEGSSIFAVDSTGTVLFRSPGSEEYEGSLIPEAPIVSNILAKRKGVEGAIGLDGVRRLFGYISVGKGVEAITVAVGIPTEVAIAEADRVMIRNFIWLGLVSILVFTVAWFFGGIFIVNPVSRLLDKTKQLAKGDLTVRTGPPYKQGEIGQLAQAFDDMAASLEKHEDERRQAEAVLADRTAQLERINRKLVVLNAELDDFTYMASHDLQEPLQSLTAFSQLLRQDLDGSLPEKAAKDLNFITDSANRMQTLIKGLLALSRAGRVPKKRERISPSECADRALEALALRVKETGAEVMRDKLPMVCGDSTLLTELYQNLIGNALKFIGEQRPTIRLTAEEQSGDQVFGVKDNGIGIDPKFAQRIFQPFRRLHGRAEYEGSGIGLAICRKIVERHRGKIWVESEPGKGAHFRFTISKKKGKDKDSE